MSVNPLGLLIVVNIIVDCYFFNFSLLYNCNVIVPLLVHSLRLNQKLEMPFRDHFKLRNVWRTIRHKIIFESLTAIRLINVFGLFDWRPYLEYIFKPFDDYSFWHSIFRKSECIIFECLSHLYDSLVFMDIA